MNMIDRLPARSHDAPSDGERDALRREIVDQARDIGSRAGQVTVDEIARLLDWAIKDFRVRRG